MSFKKAFPFLAAAAIAVLVAFVPLWDLVKHGRPSEYYTHIPLIPLISAYVLFRRRKRLLEGEANSLFIGPAVIAAACGLFVLDGLARPGIIGHAALCTASAVLFLTGSFVSLYGTRSFRRALFPFLFLWFMMPLPLSWMSGVVTVLTRASAAFTHLIFIGLKIPFVQEGAVFFLPGFDIRVAQECSGIRSSIALLITGVLAAQMFLNLRWKKIALILAVFPVTILKNAVRIVTLYLLSYFVDLRIIEGGFLHRSGGFIFFVLGLVILGYILWLLRSPREAWERIMGSPPSAGTKRLTRG